MLFQREDSRSDKSRLQQACLLWSHPNLPWLKTFPRFHEETKLGSKLSLLSASDDVRQAMHKDWFESDFLPHLTACQP